MADRTGLLMLVSVACLLIAIFPLPEKVEILVPLAIFASTIGALLWQALLVRRALLNLEALDIRTGPPSRQWILFLFPPVFVFVTGLIFLTDNWRRFDTIGGVVTLGFYAVLVAIPFTLKRLYQASLADASQRSFENQRTGGIIFIVVAAALAATIYKYSSHTIASAYGFTLPSNIQWLTSKGSNLFGAVSFLAQRKIVSDLAISQGISANRRGIIDMTSVRALLKPPQPLSGIKMWLGVGVSILPFLIAVAGPLASDLHHIVSRLLR
jgi:hypothetical protein